MNRIKNIIKKFLTPQQIAKLFDLRNAIFIHGYKILCLLRILPSKYINKWSKQLGHKNAHCFFGYYDVSPFSLDESKVLSMKYEGVNKPLKQSQKIEIGYFDFESDRFKRIDSTEAWCWQQGCRLQWFPKDKNDLVFYNHFLNNKLGSSVYSLSKQTVVESFGKALYTINNKGTYGLTLDFSRLHRLRPGYGYPCLVDTSEGKLCPADNGIWRVDLDTKEEKLIISIKDISRLESNDSMEGAEHYFNHLEFSPDSNEFVCFHIWVKRGKRRMRMFHSDIEGKKIKFITNEDHISHFTWKNNNEIFSYSTHKELKGMCFYKYKIKENETFPIAPNILKEDGHPSYFPRSNTILLDTYPDKFGYQKLYTYSLDTKVLSELGHFFSPISFRGEVRCDLHPRISPSGRYIAVDSSRTNKRCLYIIDLKKEGIQI